MSGARIVLLSTSLQRGGAEIQVAQLGAELRRRGWEVELISLASGLEACPGALSLEMRPGVPNPLALARLARLLRSFRPHVLHAHLFHANVTARLARLLCPAPVVISTIHSIAESPRGSTRVRQRDWAYRITDPLADATVCVSFAAAERHVAARAVNPGRVRVIPNGVDTVRFHPDAAARDRMRRQLGVGREFVWLAAGRLIWKKDYPTMLRAMTGQRCAVLFIAGAGPLESDLRAFAREVGANVRFLGERDDVAALLHAADGLLLSSVVEGLPMILLEAAAAGVPAVVTDVGGAREAVLDGHTGFVVLPGDVAGFGDAMGRLAALPAADRAAIGRAAREHACRSFDLRAVAGLWERLYRELLETAGRRSHEWM